MFEYRVARILKPGPNYNFFLVRIGFYRFITVYEIPGTPVVIPGHAAAVILIDCLRLFVQEIV